MTSAVVLNEDSHVPLVLLATLMWHSVFLLWAVTPHALKSVTSHCVTDFEA
jgi:hypothetical protein